MERKILLGLLDQMGAEYMPKIGTKRAATKVIRFAAKVGLPEELNADEIAALIELGVEIPDKDGPTVEDVMMVLVTAPAEVPGTAQILPKEIANALNVKTKVIEQIVKINDDDDVSTGDEGHVFLTSTGGKRAKKLAKKAKVELTKTKKASKATETESSEPAEDVPSTPEAPAVGKSRAKPSWIELAVDSLIDPECVSIEDAIRMTTSEFERIYDKDFTGRRCHARLNVSHAAKILMKIGKISIVGDVITHIE